MAYLNNFIQVLDKMKVKLKVVLCIQLSYILLLEPCSGQNSGRFSTLESAKR